MEVLELKSTIPEIENPLNMGLILHHLSTPQVKKALKGGVTQALN